MPAVAMMHEVDPREDLFAKVGELPPGLVWKNQVLVAVYQRPDVKTSGGLFIPQTNLEEDKFQGKVGLVIQLGPQAFVDTNDWVFDEKAALGDWVWFRASDSLAMTLNTGLSTKGVLCRAIDDDKIRGRVPHPDMVF